MKITFDELVSFLSKKYGVDNNEIIEKDSFAKIGLDSLSLFSLVEEFEQTFNIDIDTEDITEIDTVSKMYKYISSK